MSASGTIDVARQKWTAKWQIMVKGILIVSAPLFGLALFVYIDVNQALKGFSIEKRTAIAYTIAHSLKENLWGEISFAIAYAARSDLIEEVSRVDAQEMSRQLQNLVETSHNIDWQCRIMRWQSERKRTFRNGTASGHERGKDTQCIHR